MSELLEWKVRWYNIVEKIRVIENEAAEAQLVNELSILNEPRVLGFANSFAMNSMVNNQSFYHALYGADVILRDGSGMSMLMTRLMVNKGLNMNGTDFIPKLLEAYRGKRVAFWGTEEPYLSQAVELAKAKFGVQIVSVHHGFDPAQAYVALAKQHQPQLIVLGMGMPKQEKIAEMVRDTNMPVLIVCGGAIIDFMGNKVKRAPKWVRKISFEWAYRLMLEPKRLYRRYVLGNPMFIYRLLRMHRAAVISSKLPLNEKS
ncbi:MAG: WecB/TagA/CpsF family glycosyltransferase [Methylophilaceae bacterium]